MRNVINKRAYKVLTICIISLFISACMQSMQSKAVRYETIERPGKPENYPVEILDSKDIKSSYKVIGLIQVNAGKRSDSAKVIGRLRNEARKLGGDALIDLQQQPIGGGVPTQSGTIYSGHVRDLWTAKVIVWE